MKKEVIVAIIIGFALGLVITFGIWSANRQMNQEDEEVSPVPTTPVLSPTPTPEAGFLLEVKSPPDNYLSSEDQINVSGQTQAGAVVVILLIDQEYIITADEDGKFSQEIDLTGGLNQVLVSAHNLEGENSEKSLNIIYSTAEI